MSVMLLGEVDADLLFRAMDVTMLEIGNAKERDLDEWRSLFAHADTRFKFKGITQPEGSDLALIEAVWEEENSPV